MNHDRSSTITHVRPGVDKWWLIVIYCLIVALLAALCLIYSFKPQSAFNLASERQYGLRTLREMPCSETHSSAPLGIVFGINLAASIVIAASDHAKIGLLAPTPEQYEADFTDLGLHTLRNFLGATLGRKTLFVSLIFSSLPIHYLSNSIIFIMNSGYKFYEVVASTSFLNGINRETKWPEGYGGIEQLENLLRSVQSDPTILVNLSRTDCTSEYNNVMYSNYRTLILISDYHLPNNNNSVLAIGVLPGYRWKSIASSLLALCPDAYLEIFKGASRPDIAFIENDRPRPMPVACIDQAEVVQISVNESSVSALRSRQLGADTAIYPTDYYNPLAQIELCYQYWPEKDYTFENRTFRGLLYTRPSVPFSYCSAERLPSKPTCRLVYSPMTTFIFGIILVIKLALISIAAYFRIFHLALYRYRDVRDHYHLYGEKDDQFYHRRLGKVYSWYQGVYSTPGIDFAAQLIIYLIVFIWIWILWAASKGRIMSSGFSPSAKTDTTWFFKSVLFYKSLHIILSILAFFQENMIDWRVSTLERAEAYNPPPSPETFYHGLWRKLKTFALDFPTWLMIFMPLRTTLIHMFVGWMFPFRFVDIAELGQDVGTLVGSVPTAYWSLGPWDIFNQTSNSGLFVAYDAIQLTIFVVGPFFLLEGVFFGVVKLRDCFKLI
ncbi:uncharacterized protein EAE97_009397 [Botrytis byssoidea]|uniref:DUF6536 domain-containing protein n=1 Tax=Botrytis byssoidea TaxID=139641 RepID=A0A9P5I6P7_9HELO|nr:uncharacterized protein EAE97_009397 [Botrytis byssoidea]KAF7931188.1 hypothetical protein EAE97_009397 [Botrytis byssoidea]